MKRSPSTAEMERARRVRDASYDGVFWVCVQTTGIFCRPSCPAKTPHRNNVVYAFSIGEAVVAGFRPCRRCRPTETSGRQEEWVRALLRLSDDNRDRRLTDFDLRAAGINPVRARRHFRSHFGVTFHAYHRLCRLGQALVGLKEKRGRDVLVAGLDCGYESDSGFRDAFTREFGATPGRSGQVSQIVVRTVESPVGPLQLGATERGLCLLEFADRRALPSELALLRKRFGCPVVPGSNEYVDQVDRELGLYFDRRLTDFETPLEMTGTAFQRRVWEALRRIPYGATQSYGQLAASIGRPGAQRAVGQANGANRIAIVIPCHRVIQSDGNLRGYGGGLWRKQFLLELEASVTSSPAEPVPAEAGVCR